MGIKTKCQWNVNPDSIPIKICGKEAKWEIGFCHADWSGSFEASGENEYQEAFCDEHFIGLSGCGNVVEFRKIGIWLDFSDYDNPYTLKELTEEKDKIYTQKNNLKQWLE